LRNLVSAYEDVVKAGVRLKNKRAALYRGEGMQQRQRFDDQACRNKHRKCNEEKD
jgi:hypothetical protein